MLPIWGNELGSGALGARQFSELDAPTALDVGTVSSGPDESPAPTLLRVRVATSGRSRTGSVAAAARREPRVRPGPSSERAVIFLPDPGEAASAAALIRQAGDFANTCHETVTEFSLTHSRLH